MQKISIIVPIYNAENFIEKCVSSLLRQTYPNIEILLINDGSTDNSHDVCINLETQNDNILYIYKENGGPNSARKKGLEVASGDLISFIDVDDYLELDGLEIAANHLLTTNSDILQFGYKTVDIEGKTIKYGNIKKYSSSVPYVNCEYMLSLRNSTAFLVNKLYRKEVFDGIKWVEYSYAEDYCVLVQLYGNSSKITTIEDCLYNYVQNPNSAVHSPFSLKKLTFIDSGKFVLDYVNNNFSGLEIYPIHFITEFIVKLAVDAYWSKIDNKNNILINLKVQFKDYYKKLRKLKKGKKIRISKSIYLYKISPFLTFLLKKRHLFVRRSSL